MQEETKLDELMAQYLTEKSSVKRVELQKRILARSKFIEDSIEEIKAQQNAFNS